MTIFQKEQLRCLRSEGKSYSKIADCLGISENTIKSYCQRNNLRGMHATSKAEQVYIGTEDLSFYKEPCEQGLIEKNMWVVGSPFQVLS